MNSILPKTSQGYFFEREKPLKHSRISVLSARYNIRPSHADVKTIVHPFWVLDYSYGNCGFCIVGKKSSPRLARPAGIMHLYRPNTKYWEDTSSGPLPLQSAFITFFGGEDLDLLKHVNKGNGFGRFIDKTEKAGELFMEAALASAQDGERSYWHIMSKFYGIIDLLHSAQTAGDGNEKVISDPDNECNLKRENVFVETVRTYLRERIDKDVSIADLARRMNASVSTISHKYRELTGESPMKTLTTFRINAVKNLLAKGESMKFIASQTGFCDEFHLSKVFKKATGTSPSSYLKRLQIRY